MTIGEIKRPQARARAESNVDCAARQSWCPAGGPATWSALEFPEESSAGRIKSPYCSARREQQPVPGDERGSLDLLARVKGPIELTGSCTERGQGAAVHCYE